MLLKIIDLFSGQNEESFEKNKKDDIDHLFFKMRKHLHFITKVFF